MIEIQAQLFNVAELEAAFKRAPITTLNEVSKAVNKARYQVEREAKITAPVNKQTGGGTLRQSITSKMLTRLSAEIVAEAPYSGFVHGFEQGGVWIGTRPHDIEVKNKKVLANKRTGQFFGKKVHHPGTKANPFLWRGLKNAGTKIDEFFQTAMANVLKTFPK